MLTASGIHIQGSWASLVFGISILAAAFLVAWAAEAGQKDISQALALAAVALITVMPEYSVDLYLAWMAGANPGSDYVHFATANMTGANRLLVGLGWPLVALLFWFKARRAISVGRGISLELLVLLLATIYAFTIPWKNSLALWDGAILVSLFVAYLWLSARAEHVEPELIGPAALIGSLSKRKRRAVALSLFIFSAAVIIFSVEPFTEGLLALGHQFEVEEYLLIQWVAPLASEAPEIAIAAIFTLRGNAMAALIALVSAKVNQWTLLIGTLPGAYAISSAASGYGLPLGLPLDSRQVEEIFLTAAQSLLAMVLLLGGRLTWRSGLMLFALWGGQLWLTAARYIFAFLYLGLSVALLALDRERLRELKALVPNVWKSLRVG
ncbi:MAG: sodium:calcium antiporter [Chloroflexi bacterium]|nr:sodium:calcium antiporter [Chloroflexota bacterium]